MTDYCWVICLGESYDYIVDSVYETQLDAHNYMTSIGYKAFGELSNFSQSYTKKRSIDHKLGFDHAWIQMVPFKKGIVK
jgi:hypothetical protein